MLDCLDITAGGMLEVKKVEKRCTKGYEYKNKQKQLWASSSVGLLVVSQDNMMKVELLRTSFFWGFSTRENDFNFNY